jgi:chorismate-pyruvate lyase
LRLNRVCGLLRVTCRLSALALMLVPALAQSVRAASSAAAAPEWFDTPLVRLEALALIQTLNAELLSSNSATTTLERWCQTHALADPPVILARRTDTVQEPPRGATRQDLQLSEHEPVRYRRVELVCGDHVLSVAENWYAPDRLTAAMNQQLETTQTPFGKVVQPLRPHRETIAAQVLWSPLPAGWETAGRAESGPAADRLELPAALFEHRAVLYTPDHRAIAEVHEVYQRDVLAFPEPQLGVQSERLRATR